MADRNNRWVNEILDAVKDIDAEVGNNFTDSHLTLLKERLDKYFDNMYLDVWYTDDVIGTAKDMGIDLTIERARAVLDQVEEDFDASAGVNWDIIRSAIDRVEDGDS